MTDARMCQVDEHLSRPWLRHIQFFDLGRKRAWLVVHSGLVLLGQLSGRHCA